MSNTGVIIRGNASQMEEHLTNALVYVVSQYQPGKFDAGPREQSSRISALINVLAWEIANVTRVDDRDLQVRGLLNEVQWRVRKSTGEHQPAPMPVAH